MKRPAFVPLVVRPAFVASVVAVATCAWPSSGRADEKPSEFIMSMAEEIARPPWKDGDPRSERLRLRLPTGMIWVTGPSESDGGSTCRSYESTSIATGLVVQVKACDRATDEALRARLRQAPEATLDSFMSTVQSSYDECPAGRAEVRSREPLDGAPARVALLECPSSAGTKRVVVGFVLGNAVHSVEVLAEGPGFAVEAATPALLDIALTASPCNADGAATACRDENAPAAQAVDERVRVRWRGVRGWKRASPPEGSGDRCVAFERTTEDGVAAHLNACTLVPKPGTEGAKATSAGGSDAFLDAFVANLRGGVPNCPEQETDLVSSEPLAGAPSRLVLITCSHGSDTTLRVVRLAVGRAIHQVDASLRADITRTADAFAEITALMSTLELCDANSDAACPLGSDAP